MKLYQEQTLTFQAKRLNEPWREEKIPVLELREGPWWAFLQEKVFRCASSHITTHYVRGYKKERYLQITDYEGHFCNFQAYNKKLTDDEMRELTQVEVKPWDSRWIPPDVVD